MIKTIGLLVDELIRDEGFKASPYRDTKGIMTVGVGHNLESSPLPGEKYPMSTDRIKQVLQADIATVIAELDKKLPWWRQLDDVRQRVLANMAFNMGINTLMTFKNTLGNIKAGAYTPAAAGMRASLWAKQVKGRAERLATAMETGVMPK